jgi:hypothetical protein
VSSFCRHSRIGPSWNLSYAAAAGGASSVKRHEFEHSQVDQRLPIMHQRQSNHPAGGGNSANSSPSAAVLSRTRGFGCPLPLAADGSTYLLTLIDRTTCWLEAVPLKTMDARSCTDAFMASWVSRYGVPSHPTTDRGRQFTSALWTALCSRLGVSHITTTAYHPQANGMVVRAHRQIKEALRARLPQEDWPLHLPWVLLGLRAAPKEDSAISSAELVFGAPLTLPGEILEWPELSSPHLVHWASQPQPLPTRPLTYAQVTASVPAQLKSARFVYIRRGGVIPPLAPLYHGPYAVLEAGEKTFRLFIDDREEVVSVDRLKPHLGTAPVLPATPPARGHPPSTEGGSSAPAPGCPTASAGGGGG